MKLNMGIFHYVAFHRDTYKTSETYVRNLMVGESKIAAEEYIKDRFVFPAASPFGDFSFREEESGRCSGKQVYILRPCMIHGPGNKGNLNLLYNVVKKGIPWPLGAFENRRSKLLSLCEAILGV